MAKTPAKKTIRRILLSDDFVWNGTVYPRGFVKLGEVRLSTYGNKVIVTDEILNRLQRAETSLHPPKEVVESEEVDQDTPLPEDFPAYDTLIEAGLLTIESVRAKRPPELIALGIPPDVIVEISEALDAED